MDDNWEYDAERYSNVAEQQAMLDYQATDGCRMEFVLRQLDDPHATACDRCDNCTKRTWDTSVSETAAAEARDRLRRPGVEVMPPRQWLPGMAALGVPLWGKIAVTEQADIGGGKRLRALLGVAAPDQPVPDDVFDACVKVLTNQRRERPVKRR